MEEYPTWREIDALLMNLPGYLKARIMQSSKYYRFTYLILDDQEEVINWGQSSYINSLKAEIESFLKSAFYIREEPAIILILENPYAPDKLYLQVIEKRVLRPIKKRVAVNHKFIDAIIKAINEVSKYFKVLRITEGYIYGSFARSSLGLPGKQFREGSDIDVMIFCNTPTGICPSEIISALEVHLRYLDGHPVSWISNIRFFERVLPQTKIKIL